MRSKGAPEGGGLSRRLREATCESSAGCSSSKFRRWPASWSSTICREAARLSGAGVDGHQQAVPTVGLQIVLLPLEPAVRVHELRDRIGYVGRGFQGHGKRPCRWPSSRIFPL